MTTSQANEFVFTEDMIRAALEANGWREVHVKDFWVHSSTVNPDWSGVPLMAAFRKLLHESNLYGLK